MIRRHLGALVFALAAILAVPQVGRAALTGTSDPSIVVAVVATLTGPKAVAGQDVVDGLNLALKQMGQRFANQEVRTVVVDDRGSPDSARQVVARLLEHEHPTFVLTAVSPGSLAAILPRLVEAKLFVLNLQPAPAALAGAACSAWLFDLGGPVDGMHEAAGVQMTADKVKRLVVVAPDNPGSRDAVAALKRTFQGDVVDVLKPRHGATLFDAELARIQELKPDAVYDLLTGGTGVEFIRGWETAGLKGAVQIYAPWTGFERVMLPAMGDTALDVTTLGSWAADLDNPPNHRLVNEFESEYGRPASTWVAEAYDSATLLDAALKVTVGHNSDQDLVRNALRRVEFQSVRGSFHFATNQFAVLPYYVRKIARDAKGRLTSETHGIALKDWRDRNVSACPMRWDETPLQPAGAKVPPKPVPAKPAPAVAAKAAPAKKAH